MRVEISAPPREAEPRRKPVGLRRILLIPGPAVVLAGGLFAYTAGGRYVSTDNAYVHAGKLTVATDVSGIVADVAVQRRARRSRRGRCCSPSTRSRSSIALAGAEGQSRHRCATSSSRCRRPSGRSTPRLSRRRPTPRFFETSFQRQQDLLKRGVAVPGGLRPGQARPRRGARARDSWRRATPMRTWRSSAVKRRRPDRAECELPRRAGAGRQGASAISRAPTVLAPIPGIVTNVDALQVGEYLPAAQPAFSLVSSADVWIEANPKESDLTYLQGGRRRPSSRSTPIPAANGKRR